MLMFMKVDFCARTAHTRVKGEGELSSAQGSSCRLAKGYGVAGLGYGPYLKKAQGAAIKRKGLLDTAWQFINV
jgi:hypothetical protein